MKIGIMQPYFMPYIGYFQLIKAVDKYVVYDDVNYIKGGWINRNNLLVSGEIKLFTIILDGASPNKLINQIRIKDNFKKLKGTLLMNYSKAPYYKDVINILDKIFSFEDKQLANFISNSIKEINGYLNIKTEIIISSELDKDCNLKGKDKVINICNHLNANEYINAIGGMELYNKEEFRKNGIKLSFIKTEPIKYNQFNNDFIPFLSIIDVLMFNSIEEINNMLDKYTLIH